MQHPSITLENAHSLKPIAKFPVGWITELDWAPDGQTLAVANVEDVSLFKFQGNQVVRQRLTGHTEPLRTCHFSPNGEWLATAGDDATIRLWNVAPNQPDQCFVIQAGGEVQQVQFSPDGSWLAAAVGNVVQIWETSGEFALVRTLSGHEGDVSTVAISPDGKQIASAGWDTSIRIWDRERGICYARLDGHDDRINRLNYFPQSSRLISAGRDGTLRIWNTTTFEVLNIITAHSTNGIDGLALNQHGTILVTGGRDHLIYLWNTSTWQNIATLQTHTKPVMCVAICPDSSLLASAGGDNKVMVWAASL